MEYINYYISPIGKIILKSDGSYLTGLDFIKHGETKTDCKNLKIFDEVKRWLDIYFQGKKPNFTPKIKLFGTPFQSEVWEILKEIDFGETSTYGKIAETLAFKKGLAKMSAQAVGSAIGKNPILIIIPCHRVIGSNGSLTGYRGGIELKSKLLEIEKII